MEVQCRPLRGVFHYPREEGTENLNESLFSTAMELERTVESVQEEIGRKEDELIYVKDLLRKTLQERDAAKSECRRLMLEKVILQQKPPQQTQLEDEPSQPALPENLSLRKPLPEKGKLLQAVVEAGPLLQTLLLAGPLPQWQHPPPLNAIEIPPVVISPKLLHQESCGSTTECPDFSPETKL